MTYFNEFGQARLGWNIGTPSGGGGGIDSDAQAFITAANITDTTQRSAINTLVTQLKTYGIWTKMKALYPFVGGTAEQHRFNLKDPRAVDAAFYLTFYGGGTHSATGYLPNGNSYADTKLTPSIILSQNSTHISSYSRTNNNSTTPLISDQAGTSNVLNIFPRYSATNDVYMRVNSSPTSPLTTSTTSTGLYVANRISSTETRNSINSVLYTQSSTSTGLNSSSLWLSRQGSAYDNRESAFASIGDGLTDTEAANFYTAVQTFQTTLNRHVGVPIVADTDAQAFLNAAVITASTQATAINTLVTSLKSANIWTKMKALYPFVGGTAAQHRFNLKDPRPVNEAFYLTFYGGGTHSENGYLPNGNSYADTKLSPSSVLQSNYHHLSYYSRTSTIGNLQRDIASFDNGMNPNICVGTNTGVYLSDSTNYNVNRLSVNITSAQGLFMSSRITTNSHKIYRNGSQIGSTDTYVELNRQLPTNVLYIGAANVSPFGISSYSTKESAFASIGDGLTDAEATAFYNAVQAYQVALGRQV